MAPLVVGVAWLASGILFGLQRSAPEGGGPLLLGVAAAGGVLAFLLAARGQGAARDPISPRPTLRWSAPLLLLLAGACLGMTVRTAGSRSCREHIPASLPLGVAGVVEDATRGAAGSLRLELMVETLEIGGVVVPCGSSLPARWENRTLPAPGARVAGHGRWWSPPGVGGIRRPGLCRNIRASPLDHTVVGRHRMHCTRRCIGSEGDRGHSTPVGGAGW